MRLKVIKNQSLKEETCEGKETPPTGSSESLYSKEQKNVERERNRTQETELIKDGGI